jgi:hypothetical protein
LKAKLNEKLDNVNNQSKTTQIIVRQEAVKLLEQAKKSEPQFISDLLNLAKKTNGEMIGLEYRFKSEESLTRKLNDSAARQTTILVRKGLSSKEAFSTAISSQTNKINDALRYTISFPTENYRIGYEKTINSLKQKGYKIERVWDAWLDAGRPEDSGYRGINATIVGKNGQKFELQFHTPESFEMKMKTHELYEEKRLNTTSLERKTEITKIMKELIKTIPIPPNK